jgi:hypothetical protein
MQRSLPIPAFSHEVADPGGFVRSIVTMLRD